VEGGLEWEPETRGVVGGNDLGLEDGLDQEKEGIGSVACVAEMSGEWNWDYLLGGMGLTLGQSLFSGTAADPDPGLGRGLDLDPDPYLYPYPYPYPYHSVSGRIFAAAGFA
jgi:hypothetical protein